MVDWCGRGGVGFPRIAPSYNPMREEMEGKESHPLVAQLRAQLTGERARRGTRLQKGGGAHAPCRLKLTLSGMDTEHRRPGWAAGGGSV